MVDTIRAQMRLMPNGGSMKSGRKSRGTGEVGGLVFVYGDEIGGGWAERVSRTTMGRGYSFNPNRDRVGLRT